MGRNFGLEGGGSVCLSHCRPSQSVSMLDGWYCLGEAREGERECRADLDFTSSRPCQGSPRVIIHHHHHHHHHQSCFYNTTSLVTFNRNFYRKSLAQLTSDGEISPDHSPSHNWLQRFIRLHCEDLGQRSEVNLIKYQPGLRFLCDTNAYQTHQSSPLPSSLIQSHQICL